jgi:TfoX/Sxy family transcriptional regulator of competence genes
MSFDPGLAERLDDVLERLGAKGARQKNVFGGRGFLVGSSTFVIAWEDSLIVKLTPDAYQEALATPGVTPFAPDGQKPMTTWVVVSAETVADDPQLESWVLRGLRAIGR